MSDARRKWEAQQNWSKVRAILMEEWDPIGVRSVAHAEDEYDCCVADISAMLTDENVTREMIAAHLFRMATDHMGLSATPWMWRRCNEAAAALVRLRTEFGPY